MRCESCGKNEAKFHYTKIFNGNVEEKHLCEQCAASDYDFDFDFENHFSMNKFFTGLIDPSVESNNDKMSLKCEKCGISIRTGQYCRPCSEKVSKSLQSILVKKEESKTGAKMHMKRN